MAPTTAPATAPGEDPLLRFARMGFFMVATYLIVAIMLNPANMFIFNEIYRFTMPNAMATGYGLSWNDFVRALDWTAYDGAPRARTLSPLAGIFDTKMKIWLAGFGVYLPTVSITWPLVFLAAPLMLWQLLRRALSPTAAWIGCAFFVTATSVLSTASVAMHAGKPLNLFFCVLMLWLYHRLQVRDAAGGGWAGKAGCILAIMFAQIFALLSDESAMCMVGVAPVLFLEFVWRRPAGRWAAAAGAAGFALFLVWVRLILPALVANAGFEPFALNTAEYASHTLIRLSYPYDTSMKFIWTFYAALAQPIPFFDLIAWHWRPEAANVFPLPPIGYPADLVEKLLADPRKTGAVPMLAFGLAALGLCIAYAVAVLRGAPRERAMALKALIAIAGIVTMQAVVLGRVSFGYGMYYQGGPMAVPYAVLMAAVFAPVAAGLLRATLIAALVCGALWNHMAEFRYWSVYDTMGGNDWLIRMNDYVEAGPAFNRERGRMVAWAAPHGIPAEKVEAYLPTRGRLMKPGETVETYPLLHKLSLIASPGWSEHLQPHCEVCVSVDRTGIRAVRLKGRARDLPLPDFLKDIPLIRG